MIVIANVLQELETEKTLVRPLSEKPRLRTPFVSQHVKSVLNVYEICMRAFLSSFLIIVREADLENVSNSDTGNHSCVC